MKVLDPRLLAVDGGFEVPFADQLSRLLDQPIHIRRDGEFEDACRQEIGDREMAAVWIAPKGPPVDEASHEDRTQLRLA